MGRFSGIDESELIFKGWKGWSYKLGQFTGTEGRENTRGKASKWDSEMYTKNTQMLTKDARPEK
jgi:hypothetical protein